MTIDIKRSGARARNVGDSISFQEICAGWRAEIGVGIGLIMLIMVFSALAPNFGTLGNASSILRQVSVTAVIAVGMTMVIIAGEIDLSVGAMVGLSGTVFAWLVVRQDVPMLLAVLLVFAMAAAVGAFVGVLRVGWGIPTFITTIGLLSSLRGLGFLLSNSLTIGPLPPAFGGLWYGTLLNVPVPVAIMIGVIAIGWLVLAQTRFGRHLYALGGNIRTAARYGVPVNRMRITVLVVVQCLAALGGIMFVARLNSGSATVGELLELDVIAAVIVGGTSLAGGTGRMIGTVLGVLFVAVLRNGMVLLGVDPILFMIAQGLVIILAVWWSVLRQRRLQSEVTA